MRIEVHYLAQLRQAAGRSREQIEVPAPCTLQDLVTHLAQTHGPPLGAVLLNGRGGVQPGLLLFVGVQQANSAACALRDGDVVTLLSPMAGG
jgi:molybdopterin converting factor small subunit